MKLHIHALSLILLFHKTDKFSQLELRLPEGDFPFSPADFIHPVHEAQEYCEYRIAPDRRMVVRRMSEDIVSLATYGKEQEVYIEVNEKTWEVTVC